MSVGLFKLRYMQTGLERKNWRDGFFNFLLLFYNFYFCFTDIIIINHKGTGN